MGARFQCRDADYREARSFARGEGPRRKRTSDSWGRCDASSRASQHVGFRAKGPSTEFDGAPCFAAHGFDPCRAKPNSSHHGATFSPSNANASSAALANVSANPLSLSRCAVSMMPTGKPKVFCGGIEFSTNSVTKS